MNNDASTASTPTPTPLPTDGRRADRNHERTWQIVLAMCAIASIVPLFCARHLPMADLPEHLASMATIRHYGDPSWKSAEYFTVAGVFETPYWLYHATGALLSVVTGSAERANIVMLSAVGLAYPYALRALLVALRRDPRLAIFGCALFWTNNLVIGILNFVASVPVVLFALALVIAQAERPTTRRGVGLGALAVAIFYLHLSSFALFVLDAVLLTLILVAPKNLKDAIRHWVLRLLWLLPSAVLSIVVYRVGHTIGHTNGIGVVWSPRINILGNVHAWLFDCFRSRVDDMLGTGLVLALALLLVLCRDRAEKTQREKRLARSAWALFTTALLARILSPSQVGSDALALDVRLAVFVALFAVTLPSLRRTDGTRSGFEFGFGFGFGTDRRATFLFASVTALVLGLSVNTLHEVRAFERDDVAGFDDLLRSMPRGKRLVMLNFQPQSAHVNANVLGYFGSYYRARYGGVASFSFSETSHWPVRYRPGAGPPTPMAAWGHPCVYRNRRDGAYFDYVLTHGDVDPLPSLPGPRWEQVGGSRAWRLFKKVESESAAADDAQNGGEDDPSPCQPPPVKAEM